jgi:hypothetical protein
VNKSRRVRWNGHVAHIGDRRGAYTVLVRKCEERGHMEDLGVDRRIKLKCIFKKSD